MLSKLLSVGAQVLVLFLLLLAGYCCGKAKLVTRDALSGMTNITIYLAVPCMLVSAFELNATPEMLHGFLQILPAALLCHIMNFAIATFCIRGCSDARKRILVSCATFCNCGFMGYPMLSSLMGDVGLFYGSSYNLVFNILLWTLGFHYLSADRSPLNLRKLFLNPGIVGITLGLAVFILKIQLPPITQSVVTHLGNMTVPLPMLIFGCQLADADLRSILKDRFSWLGAALRLLVLPLLSLLLLRLLGFRGDVLLATIIAAATPPAALVAMLAKNDDRDPLPASGLVSFQTLLSVLTMPVVIAVAELFL